MNRFFWMLAVIFLFGASCNVTTGNTSVDQQSESQVESSINSPTEPSRAMGITDCGVSEAKLLLTTTNKETIKTWECFTDAIMACRPAKLLYNMYPSPSIKEYQVLGKNGDDCAIYGTQTEPAVNNENKMVTCYYSKDVIRQIVDKMSVDYRGKKYLQGVNIVDKLYLGRFNVDSAIYEQLKCKEGKVGIGSN